VSNINYNESSPRRYVAADQYNLGELVAMERSRALAYLLTQIRLVLKSPDPATHAEAEGLLLDTLKVAASGKRWEWYADEIIAAYKASKL
jgi:uncharacterized protein YchJ